MIVAAVLLLIIGVEQLQIRDRQQIQITFDTINRFCQLKVKTPPSPSSYILMELN